MDKEQIRAKFDQNVEYLKRNIPPDDIYLFAEQTFMAAVYFMYKWSDWVDVSDECEKDMVAMKWVTNILGFMVCQNENQDIQLDLNIRSVEE